MKKKQYKVSFIPTDIDYDYIPIQINNKSYKVENIKYNELNKFGSKYGGRGCTYIDLSEFDTSDVTDFRELFYYNNVLESINLDNLNIDNIGNSFGNLFLHCDKLNYIKCKQHIKDLILENKKSMCFDDTPFETGEGTWEIVD